ncbi:MAG: hypothetical protein J0H74_08565 [Chitinophagaceae bacterium]|nr:hypothetical protein [Chitinophagaceae bacterium]
MKNLPAVVFFILTLSLTGSAQTYTVTSNNQSWSSLVPSGTCTNCTINVPAGWTLLLNSSGTCNGCTFNGGTMNITSNFNFNNAATTFNNDTVLINSAATFWKVNFNNDSVAVNAALSSQNGTSTVSHARMKINANVTFNAASFANDSIHIVNTTFKTNNTPADFTSCFVEVSGNSGTVYTPGSTITGSNFIFSNKSSMTLDNTLIADGSSFTMHDQSTIKSNGATNIKNSSSIVMDGTSNSFTAGNDLPISNSTVTMNSGSTLKASSITATSSTINAAGGTITSDNALTLTSTTLTSSGAISIKASSVTLQTGSAMTLGSSSSLKSDNAITIISSTLKATDATIKGSSFTAQTNSNINIGGASTLTSDNAITFKASTAKFFGNAWAKANDAVILDNGSNVTIGDGPLAGTAHLITNNTLQVLNGSQLAIANGNNYLYTSASNYTDGTNNYQIRTNTISCGAGHANSCTTGYVYGCATLNNAGAVGCVTLALSAPELTARLSNGQVLLSWQMTAPDNTHRFIVQRSTDSHDWSPISEIISNPFSSAYNIKDPQPHAGNNYYRLVLVDKDGHIAYSSICILKQEPIAGEITLYPNPIKGHTFFLRTPATDAILVKVYTLGGQLLLLSSLKGQTQYTMQLPPSFVINSYVLVQVIGNGRTQTFTVLTQ